MRRDVGDSEVHMWDDNNRRRQVGADKTTDYLKKQTHSNKCRAADYVG